MDQKLKKRAIHRAKIIRGQLDGLVKAIEEEKYCVDLITQSRSIQLSLKSMDRILLANHLKGHVKHMLADKKQENKAIKELVDLYALSNK
ncbi:metal-sensitive transcriptional regulator [Candidatus Kaiserbacteria bacterium]|nr:metal-sensitive transcriptional regulator [Candidatus Kaiserbacteria bacterium]